ncbi:MAG: hypothetical protein ACKVRO_04625 [Micropepsaceae bacterium]
MRLIPFAALLLLACLGSAAAGPLDRIETTPPGWRGPVFEPSYAFPKTVRAEPHPWDTISFRKEPERYLRLLLNYALEGQDRVDWRLAHNKTRRWYHVPWLGPGSTGREFIHGLTRARDFAPGEMSSTQTSCRQNWGLAFYNDVGGVVLGKMWGRGARDPNLDALPFPEGTVAVKLVFTEATADDDPKLAGAPELAANVHVDLQPGDEACATAADANGKPAQRAPKTLRLIQVDLAVRENRASYKTGWVFGSFRYDGSLPGTDPWTKLVPLGLMWGNDPQLSDANAAAGAKPRQSIIFPAGQGFGRGGRMNGIADDRASACSSCHMAAQWPTVARMTAPANWADAKCWFRNLDARYTFGFPPGQGSGCGDPDALSKVRALDFSLQLTIALRNWSMERKRIGRTAVGKLRHDGTNLKVDGLESLNLKQ